MGAELGWDAARQAAEVDAYLAGAHREYDVPSAEPESRPEADGVSDRFVLALDQGTTSSRAIVFDRGGRPVALAQQEFPQGYPSPGHVTHDPEDIWQSQLAVAREAVAPGARRHRRIAAIGITNQRETTIVWERATGPPRGAGHRVAEPHHRRALRRAARGRATRRASARARGCPSTPTSAGPKIAHILDAEPGLRARAEAGELCFGTVDSFLRVAPHRRPVARHRRLQRQPHAALRPRRRALGRLSSASIVGVPMAMLPEVRPSSALLARPTRRCSARRCPSRGIAGDQQAAMFGQACLAPGSAKNTYGTGAFTLLNTGEQPVPSAHGLLSTVLWQLGEGGPAGVRPGGLGVRRRAPPCAGCATACGPSSDPRTWRRWRPAATATPASSSCPPSWASARRTGTRTPAARSWA